MPLADIHHVACRKSILVPLLSGLLLLAVTGLLGRQNGLWQQSVDTFLTAGFQKYSPDLDRYRITGGSMDGSAIADGTSAAGGQWKVPVWADPLSMLLCLLVWLSLSTLFAVRPSLVLAGALIWVGGALTFSVLLLVFKGTLFSPARPLLAAVLLYFSFLFLGRFKDAWDRLQRQQRRGVFQQKMLESLADAVETRDPAAAGHIARMQHYVRILSGQLVRSGRYTDVLTPEYCRLLVHLTPLHDIGKAGIKDGILLKTGRLTDQEYEEMKRHVAYGEALLPLSGGEDEQGEFLGLAREIVACHHEKWDGSGYPKGLSGGEIPLAGRILAVADVYDALISKRCYKAAYSHEQSRAILMKGRGSAFDPVIADAFMAVDEEMLRISQKYREGTESSEFILQ